MVCFCHYCAGLWGSVHGAEAKPQGPAEKFFFLKTLRGTCLLIKRDHSDRSHCEIKNCIPVVLGNSFLANQEFNLIVEVFSVI